MIDLATATVPGPEGAEHSSVGLQSYADDNENSNHHHQIVSTPHSQQDFTKKKYNSFAND